MSRIIIKNLPKIVTQEKLIDHFKGQGVITDSKLAYRDGTFRGFAFVGFESPEQAQAAVKGFNNTYFYNSKIIVELAKDLNDASRPKSQKQLQKEKQEQAEKIKHERKLLKEKARLKASGGNASVKAAILEKHKNDPKFLRYLELNLGPNSDLLEEVKETKPPDCKKSEEMHDDSEDEGIVKDEAKLAKTQLSDREYWQSITKEVSDEEEENEEAEKEEPASDPQDSSSTKTSKWKELHSVRLRIDKFPKKAKSGSAKKSKNLSKSDIRTFFNPVKVSSIRKNQKNRFEYFIGFSSSLLMQQALKKNGSILLGVRAKVSPLTSQQDTAAVQHKAGSAPWSEAQQRLDQAEPVAESGKLFVRNLSYLVSENDLREKFSKFGEIVDLELPVCKQTRKLKGFATVSFLQPRSAVLAMNALDGTDLQGRVLHVLPALSQEQVDQMNPFKSSFKQQKAQEQKATAGSWHNWNTLFVSSAAVVDIMAKKHNKTKEQILDNEGNQSAAVTLALGETQIVDETRRFLEDNGVSVEAFSDPTVARSDTVLLVKHLPAGTKATDVAELCAKFGELGRVVMPPSGVTCVVEFLSATEAKRALKNLSYKRFGPSPLYLERAPVKTFCTDTPPARPADVQAPQDESDESAKRKRENSECDDESDTEQKTTAKPAGEPEPHTTLYVQNLPLDSTEDDIKKWVKDLENMEHVVKSRIPVIPFGALKRTFLQKHHSGEYNNGGYGFVEFLNLEDAKRALEALGLSTHLLGRRLVLQWAKEDESVDELRRKTAQKHEFAKHLGAVHKKMRHAMVESSGRTEFDE
ncbi:RNA recognition motif domain [Trinorchestia longiramus]|nr:RNA recognition motif domain [Trinorchestia longiramus]